MRIFFYSLFFFLYYTYDTFAIEQDKIIQKIQKNWNALTQFNADFEQYNSNLNTEKIFAKGKIFFQKPSLIRWQYQKPNEQLIIAGEEKIWVYDTLLDTVNISPKKEIFESSVFFYLSQKKGLFTYFELLPNTKCTKKLNQKFHLIEICLIPKKDGIPIQKLHLGITKDYQIMAFFVLNNQGQTEFYLQNFQTHKKIKKENFIFIPKKGTQIIQ